MARYIDVEPLVKALKTDGFKNEGSNYSKGFDVAIATMIGVLKGLPTANVTEIPEGGMGNLSDGYHTFNELYHHRAILFSVICNAMLDKAWKSKLHDTGDMYEGMFIVGIETPEGQATYHYDIDPYWDMFKVKELEKAPKFDGHTPQNAIDRISKLSADVAPVRRGEWEIKSRSYRMIDDFDEEMYVECPFCKRTFYVPYEFDDEKTLAYARENYPYCHCGAKMEGERSENGKS